MHRCLLVVVLLACGSRQPPRAAVPQGQITELDYFVGHWIAEAKDPSTGKTFTLVVRTIFDSAKTFGTVRSKGWQGDTLVLEGDAVSAQGRVTVRETIQRKGPDEFHAVWEAKTGDTWSAYSVETLRRQR